MLHVGIFKLDSETLIFIASFKVSELTCFSHSVC